MNAWIVQNASLKIQMNKCFFVSFLIKVIAICLLPYDDDDDFTYVKHTLWVDNAVDVEEDVLKFCAITETPISIKLSSENISSYIFLNKYIKKQEITKVKFFFILLCMQNGKQKQVAATNVTKRKTHSDKHGG